MDQQPQEQNSSGKHDRAIKLAVAFMSAAMGLFAVGLTAHDVAGPLLIESGHIEAAKTVARVMGAEKLGLRAELFTQTYGSHAAAVKGLLDMGAEPNWDITSTAVARGNPEILAMMLDKYPGKAQSLVYTVLNDSGRRDMLEIIAAHGVKFEGNDLCDAAGKAPQLLPWLLQHGTFSPRDIERAQAAAVYSGQLDAFNLLRSVSEPGDKAKGDILRAAVGRPDVLADILKIVSFSDGDKRAALADALESGNGESFGLLRARLPEAAVSAVVAAAVAGERDPRVQFLIKEVQEQAARPRAPAPQ